MLKKLAKKTKTNSVAKVVIIVSCVTISLILLYYTYHHYTIRTTHTNYEKFESKTINDLKTSLESAKTDGEKSAIKEKLLQALNTQLTQLISSLTAKSNQETLVIRYQIATNLQDQLLYTTLENNRKQLQSQYDANNNEIANLSTKQRQQLNNTPVNADPGVFKDTNIDPNIKLFISKEVASLVPMSMERFNVLA